MAKVEVDMNLNDFLFILQEGNNRKEWMPHVIDSKLDDDGRVLKLTLESMAASSASSAVGAVVGSGVVGGGFLSQKNEE
jgi:hypothetical protein